MITNQTRQLLGKTAIVTGAAQGIGAAIATAFRLEGAKVIGLDRQEVPSEICEDSRVVDLSELDSLSLLVDDLWETYGPISTMVSAAGICPTRPLMDCNIETWETVFRVNVHAPFFLMQALARKLVASNMPGQIIHLASVSAFLPKLEQVDYGASKAAVVSMTRSAAAVFGPHGIRVNAIAPGTIETPLTRQIAEQRSLIRGVTPDETLQPVIQNTPLRRIGTAKEVADLAVFLASEKSTFITGQTIDVCGGQLMR